MNYSAVAAFNCLTENLPELGVPQHLFRKTKSSSDKSCYQGFIFKSKEQIGHIFPSMFCIQFRSMYPYLIGRMLVDGEGRCNYPNMGRWLIEQALRDDRSQMCTTYMNMVFGMSQSEHSLVQFDFDVCYVVTKRAYDIMEVCCQAIGENLLESASTDEIYFHLPKNGPELKNRIMYALACKLPTAIHDDWFSFESVPRAFVTHRRTLHPMSADK